MVVLDEHLVREVGRLACRYPGLRLLILFGSRARGDAHAGSDWDFGCLADGHFDLFALLAELVSVLGTDRVDLVDLARAGGQVRFRAARDGHLLYAVDEAVFPRFWLAAVSFWCEAGPVIRAGYADVLAGLRR